MGILVCKQLWVQAVYAVDDAEDHLVEMAANDHLRFLAEEYLHDVPTQLSHFVAQVESFAQVEDSLGCH